MAKRPSVFGDEWRKCLREHYKYVIRQEDKQTESTLTPILNRFGFGEEELRELYVEATMRDMPDDFVPDMERVVEQADSVAAEPETTFKVHPAECTCPACMDIVLEEGHDEDGQPLTEPEEPEEAAGNLFAVAKAADDDDGMQDKAEDKADDTPKQKSLF